MRTILLTLLLAAGLTAQEQPLRWNGEVRFRTEADGRDFKLSTPVNLYTLSRIRLGATARPADRITVKVQLQDSRSFGQEASTTANSANLDLYEGNITIDSLFDSGVSLRMGRLPLAYGSERIIGGLGWHNVARAFDGAVVRYNSGAVRTDLLVLNISDVNTAPASVNAAGTAYTYDKGTGLYGVYSSLTLLPGMPMDLYVLHERNQNQTKKDTIDLGVTTLGGLVKGTFDAFSFEAEGALQSGMNKGGDVTASMAAVMAGYAFPGSTLSAISIHADLLSGTAAGSTKANTFSAAYSTGHKFYGFMDYFTNFPVQTFNRGLSDLYLRSMFVWNEQCRSQVALHQFNTMEPLAAAGALNTTALGQELDIVTTYKMSTAVGVETGLGLFNPNALMRTAFSGSDLGVWGYCTTTVTF